MSKSKELLNEATELKVESEACGDMMESIGLSAKAYVKLFQSRTELLKEVEGILKSDWSDPVKLKGIEGIVKSKLKVAVKDLFFHHGFILGKNILDAIDKI